MTLVIDTIEAKGFAEPCSIAGRDLLERADSNAEPLKGALFLSGVANPSVTFSNNAQSPYSFPRSAGKLGEGARVWIENHV